MVPLTALWLSILLSAVFVFVASSIIHMVFKYHESDLKKLPGEAAILETLRNEGVAPGMYAFPRAPSPKEMGSPEMIEKYNQGPVGMMTVMPSGPPAMGKYLTLWFLYCLFLSFSLAYLGGRTLAPGASYLAVFRVVGCAGFLAYSAAHISNAIWRGEPWSATAKALLDGLIYSSVTAGTFGWLWPG